MTALNLPDLPIKNALLPERYERARVALSECNRVDECKDWADKAAALASYARQADDDQMFNLARRIQTRAIRRAGELLKEFDGRDGRNLPDTKNRGGPTFSPLTRSDVGERAGMSRDQQVTAVRVANVPESEFESSVESDNPPSVTALADIGRTPRPGFGKATHLLGAVRRFAEFCDENDATDVAEGVMPQEINGLRESVHFINEWLVSLLSALEE